MADDSTLTPEEWVYAGQRIDKKGKRSHVWLPLKDIAQVKPLDTTPLNWYGPKNIATAPFVGAVYRVHVTPEESVRTTGKLQPVYVDMLQGHDAIVAEWKAQDISTKTMLDAKSTLERDKKADVKLADMTLGEVGVQYRLMLTGPRRNAYLAAILATITQTRVSDSE